MFITKLSGKLYFLHGTFDSTHFHNEVGYSSVDEEKSEQESSNISDIDSASMALGCRQCTECHA